METATAMDDDAFNFPFFQTAGIGARNIKVCGLNATQLKSRGVASALDLRSLGFSALDLIDGAFCASCVSAYGAEEMVTNFLCDASDAVMLAGSPAVPALGLDVCTLLLLCAGAPTQACAVIEQSPPRGGALAGVPPDVLLDTGVRARRLKEIGYTRDSVARQTRATPEHLAKLEF